MSDDQRLDRARKARKTSTRKRPTGRTPRNSPYSGIDFGDATAPAKSAPAVGLETEQTSLFVREPNEVDAPIITIFDQAAVLRQLRLAAAADDTFGEYDIQVTPAASSDEQARIDRLRALASQHSQRPLVVGDVVMINRIRQLRIECPGFGSVAAIIERAAALSTATGTGLGFPAILLVGPPGLGKTHFGRRLATALNSETHAFSCATNSDAQALLVGHPPTWRGSRMGVLTEALLGGETGNPLIILDEVDKFVTHSSEKPFHSLLTLLEPENASSLLDEYLRVEFDLSRCLIIATANDIHALPTFILDRFLVVEIAMPDGEALRDIARRIAADMIAGYRHMFAPVSEPVIERLARTNPRGIRRLVGLALGYAADQGRRYLEVSDVTAAEACMDFAATSRPIGFLGGRSRHSLD
ncbi:ATP-dependent Lon protease [Bosea sp. OAE506]|uniref:AAA family ATPase n=1 Tax=Bosea sp. OAE506 TaxID=2663870 RepID=UPI00178966FC